MIDEGTSDGGGIRPVDLNLYLGLPRLPYPRRTSDLGSDLSLNSIISSSNGGDATNDHPPSPVPAEVPESPSDAAIPFPYFPSPPPPATVDPVSSPDDDDGSDTPSILIAPHIENPGASSPPYVQYLPSIERPQTVDAPPPLFGENPDRPSTQDLHFRFQSLIETTRRWRARRFQLRFRGIDPRPADSSGPTIEAAAAAAAVHKALEDAASNDEKGETATAAGSTADFECNVCLEVARDPVVTSCGHLFCWPCLYQWLHAYSDSKECPVCKGEVTESNVTPIYGRGGGADSQAGKNKGLERDGELGLKIPPRPKGFRIESWRQQLRHRPHPRRVGERLGPWRVQSSRWRAAARVLQQSEGENPDVERNVRAAPQTASSSGMADEELFNDGLRRFVLSIPAAAGGGSSQHRGLAVVDQALASSTMGVIQGGGTVSDASAGPNSAGTSRASRRMRRSGDVSSSRMELDDFVLQGRRRRRQS
ncbi:E3 ubiquitin-protein ligase RMA3 [Acorus calamus]|uniref:E3 ubiquitin-protein ligase RMA n=1 Tax=Acorus calamus TaxID=4465 RepID=A0AAV9DX43_ACOCL|nr:E3 ubiquitin-protein ligase RMA3 [Acorus calamus]